ncbi:MAG TPA: FUSC family protein, partial [Acidimicrobiales bacterium]|nr:FUSC family protein [Acidimicrobiales bacterium]
SRSQVFLAAKIAISASVAWVAALATHPRSQPYFAPLAVLLIVQPTVFDSVSRAFQRVVGVVLGVVVALGLSYVLAPSVWSIGLIMFLGLLVGWAARLGPQGVVQVPVSALLAFVVGHLTPGYGGERITDTLIGAGIALVVVLLSPTAPKPDAIASQVQAPIRRCGEILGAIAAGIQTQWTRDQAQGWRDEALTLIAITAKARQDHDANQVSARWNARAYRERPALERADQALVVGDRLAASTRSIARALVDGSDEARPMPALSAMVTSTVSAIEAYGAWVTSLNGPNDGEQLAEALQAADDTLASTLTRAQQRWGADATQWLTFGTVLAMTQRILGELSPPGVGPRADP